MGCKYRLTTLGCKVSQYESQQIRDLFSSLGVDRAGPGETPDIAVVNTCTVTARASSRSRRAIRRIARGGSAPVIVVGCGATADAERLGKLDCVDAVIGLDTDVCTELRTLVIHRLQSTQTHPLDDAMKLAEPAAKRPDANGDDVWMIPGASNKRRRGMAPQTASTPLDIMTPKLPVVKPDRVLNEKIREFADHHRAFLKIQDGCDAFCAYCIVPRLRPVLRSKPIDVAVAEAHDLVRAGHREICVTGICLGAYGRDTAVRKRRNAETQKRRNEETGMGGSVGTGGRFSSPYATSIGPSPLAELVEALARVDGLERVRLSSLEPCDVDESLLSVLSAHKACMPHLHLPLQSGSPMILGRMNRQYTPEAFVELVDVLRGRLDHPAITTDILVGFPGETDMDFQATLDVARHVGFLKIHAFPFSPRPQTAAEKWQEDFVPPAKIRKRMAQLAQVEQACSLAYRRTLLGRIERVLVERTETRPSGSVQTETRPSGNVQTETRPSGSVRLAAHGWSEPPVCCRGRAERYFEVHFESEGVRPGEIVSVRLDRVTPAGTHGTHVRNDE